jgi:hypothetical protein
MGQSICDNFHAHPILLDDTFNELAQAALQEAEQTNNKFLVIVLRRNLRRENRILVGIIAIRLSTQPVSPVQPVEGQ